MAFRLLIVCPALFVVTCSTTGNTTPTFATDPVPASGHDTDPPVPASEPPRPTLGLTSPAFADGAPIPKRFTCEGEDTNPRLDLVGLPVETVALAIIMDDPDAPVGVWDHWVEYNIEAASGEFTIEEASSSIGVEGVNSWKVGGYGGPCPPPGETHRYFIRVYVLNDEVDLPPGVDADGLRSAMNDKIVDEVTLMGTYQSASE